MAVSEIRTKLDAAAYAATTARIYVNGAHDVTGTLNRSSATADMLSVGAYLNNGTWSVPYGGTIFDVRIWDRTLPASEIAELRSDPWALYTPRSRVVRGSQGVAGHAYYYRNFVASGANR